MAKRENDLGRDPIGKLLLRLAVPTVTAQLVNALYNIVDRIYIGHIPGEGDLALTGLGICFPVILFVSAISALVGMGGGSRAVVRMGEGKLDEANKILGNCTLLLMILGLAATVVFQLCKEPMLYLFGATENTIGYSMDYLNIYLYGSIFVELALGLNFFITSQGFSTVGMASVIIGAVVNIVLDPILIFGLNMGVKGAALATITAQAVSAVWWCAFCAAGAPSCGFSGGFSVWMPRCWLRCWPWGSHPSLCSPPRVWSTSPSIPPSRPTEATRRWVP